MLRAYRVAAKVAFGAARAATGVALGAAAFLATPFPRPRHTLRLHTLRRLHPRPPAVFPAVAAPSVDPAIATSSVGPNRPRRG
jgi:hypothetical protein